MNCSEKIILGNLKFFPNSSNNNSPLILDIELPLGTMLLVVGSSCGKTSIAHTISGLRSSQQGTATIQIGNYSVYPENDIQNAKKLALIPTIPTYSFSGIFQSLEEELMFSNAFLGLKPDKQYIDLLVDELKLKDLLNRNPFTLSGGEKIRAAIAISLVKKPELLIMDDMFSELNPGSHEMINNLINKQRRENNLTVIQFHTIAPDPLIFNKSFWVFVTKTGLISGDFHSCWPEVSDKGPELLSPLHQLCAKLQKKNNRRFDQPPMTVESLAGQLQPETIKIDHFCNTSNKMLKPFFSVKELLFKYEDNDQFTLGPLSYDFKRKRTTAILGENGAGKTTLLKCLGNLIHNWEGEIFLLNNKLSKDTPLHRWAHDILYCFQNPDDQLFLPTVRGELKETARRVKVNQTSLESKLEQVIKRFHLGSFLDQGPLSLPRPIKRIVSIAGAFIASPSIILLDEPTSGLDQQMIDQLVSAINEYEEKGGTVILVSHDYEFVTEVADDFILVTDGKIKTVGSVETGFSSWPGATSPIVPQIGKILEISAPIWRKNEVFKFARWEY